MKKSIFIGLVVLFGCSYGFAQCASNIIITAGYSTTLTQSNNWIVSSGTTTIPTGSNVTLEATDYILLNPDFTADANAVFLAHIVPCRLSLDYNSLSLFKVYPNPTSGIVNIQSVNYLKSVIIYDSNGRVLTENRSIQSNEFEANLASFSNGIYFLEIASDSGILRQKIIKY